MDLSELSQAYDRLPKYLVTVNGKEKETCYHLSLIKWEWDGHKNAYIAMYARARFGYHNGIWANDVLFFYADINLEKTLTGFLNKFNEESANIKGRQWTQKPIHIDINNIR